MNLRFTWIYISQALCWIFYIWINNVMTKTYMYGEFEKDLPECYQYVINIISMHIYM